MKAQKRPVVIDFMYYTGDIQEVKNWVKSLKDEFDKHFTVNNILTTSDSLVVKTLEGTSHALIPYKDVIIRGVKGEYYSCKKDIFQETYEILQDKIIPKKVILQHPSEYMIDIMEATGRFKFLESDGNLITFYDTYTEHKVKISYLTLSPFIKWLVSYFEKEGMKKGELYFKMEVRKLFDIKESNNETS